MYFKTFKTSFDKFYVYEANKNSIYSIKESEFNSLQAIEKNKYSFKDEAVLKRFNDMGLLKPLNIEKVEHSNLEMLPFKFNKGINNIVLQITQGCNLTCSYCPFADGNMVYNSFRVNNRKDISIDIIDKSINLLEKNSLCEADKYISFYGGEPLIRKDLIIHTIKRAVSKFGKDMVYFGMTTNATLLDLNFIEQIKGYNFDILVSFDGPKEIHNLNRKFNNNNGSYDIIYNNLMKIKFKYPEIFEKIKFNVVVPPSIEYNRLFEYVRNKEGHLTAENTSLNTLSNNYIDEPIQYGKKFFEESNFEMFKTIVFLLKKNNRHMTIFKNNINSLYMFSKFLKPLRKTPKIAHPSGTCIPGLKKLFINVNGDFFPCEKANENSKIQKIGNITKGFDFEKIKYLMNIGSITSQTCKKCRAFNLCSVCPVVADDGNSNCYRSNYKLKKCKMIKEDILNNLRMHCLLKENNFQFDNEIKEWI